MPKKKAKGSKRVSKGVQDPGKEKDGKTEPSCVKPQSTVRNALQINGLC